MKKLLLCIPAIVFLILVSASWADTNCSESLVAECFIDTNYTFNGTYNYISGININSTWATIDFNGTTFKGNGSGTGLNVTANNTTITGVIVDNFTWGIRFANSKNTTVVNSTINNSNSRGIWFSSTNTQNITITDNTIYNGSPIGNGIYFDASPNNTITNNVIYDFSNNGIYMLDADNNTIVNNTIYDIGDSGIYIYTNGINNLVINNTAYNCSNGGLSVYDNSSNNTLENNTVYNNTFGIYFTTSNEDNTVLNNTVYNNSRGIYFITSSNNNTITNNTVYDNSLVGINVTLSGDNLIYNNWFNNSPVTNAWSNQSNDWNTSNITGTNIIGGALVAGNYWDDYGGLDVTGDDLGDTERPYNSSFNISVGGDYAPLKENYTSGLTLTVSPSTSVNVGTDVTITCSATLGTLVLRNNGTIVSNPYSSVLDVGVYTFNCTNFIGAETGDSKEVNVTVSTTLVEGCRYNTTYAYKGEFIVTNNTTVIDMQSYVNNSIVRSNLSDVWIPSAIDVWTNESRYLILNVSGEIGNNLTVYFGNYLNNNTVNVSYSGDLTPTNNFTNVTQINNFVMITHMDEVGLVEFNPPNASMTYDLYCTAGHMEFDIPNGTADTKFLFSTFSKWNESHITIYYSTNDFYKRHIMHDSTTEYRNMWLVDAQTYQIAQVVNDLDDLIGDWQRARLTVKKWIGDQIRTIDQQQFDASGFLFFYGIVGDRYIYEIYNGEETRVLGNIVIDLADLTKVITIGKIEFSGEEFLKNFTFGFNYTNETGILTVDYYDPYNLTNNVNITVINTNGTQVYFADSTSNDVTFSFLVPNRTARYKVELRIDHDPNVGEALFVFFITPIPTLVLRGISDAMQTLIALGAVFMINLSVSPKNAAFGAMLGAVMAFFFAVIGWLSVGFGVISVILLLSIFLLYSREVKKD